MFTGDGASLTRLEPLSHDKNRDVAAEALRAMRAIRVRISAAIDSDQGQHSAFSNELRP
jgi:hypothetical protein